MDNKKVYSIQINGIDQSIKQVDALSDALQFLDKKIKELESRSVSVTSTQSGNGNRNADLQTEDKLLKQIQNTEQQIRDARREDYQSLLAQKDLLKDITDEAKQRAAAERLSVGNYDNTMKGLKQELADIKSVMQTTDLGSEKFQEMSKRAGELTQKLKGIEEAYGQFGRNVGNYKSAFDDIKKITVQIGNTDREFNSVRDASRQLNQELKAMVIAGKEGTKEYNELAEAVHKFEMASKRAESAVNDLKASSKTMDDLLDTFQSFTALGQIGQGFTAFFGIDDSEIQRSIQKLVALQNVMQGIEKIRQQMNTNEGLGAIFSKGSASVDAFVSKLTGAKVTMEGLTMSTRTATVAVRGLSLALKSIGIGLALWAISEAVDAISKFSDEMDSASKQADVLDENLKALNATYKNKIDLLSSSYMSKQLSDEQYLTETIKTENEYISRQIELLKERAAAMNEENSSWFHFFESYSTGGGFTGQKFSGSQTIRSYNPISTLMTGAVLQIPQLEVTIKDMQQLESEWKKMNEAVKEGKDYFDKWGNGLLDWTKSLYVTVGDTERIMRSLGNVKLSDFIASFQEVQRQFNEGEISAEEYAKEIGKLKNEMNSSEILQSVVANLDKYIPDDKVRQAVQNIIDQLFRLDDAFNMTSEQQIHYWNQVRIDAMADGAAKIRAQIEENRRHEIAEYGHTQEQIILLDAKYNRQLQDQLSRHYEQAASKAKQHAREVEEAERELNSLRIQNMQEGLNKQLAQLEEEKRQKLQKAKENGIMVGEITIEIEKLYEKKSIELKKEWARKTQKIYADLWNRIFQINQQSAQMNFENELRNLETEYKKLQEEITSMLDETTASYSMNMQGISQSTARKLGRADTLFPPEMLDEAKEYIDILQTIQILEGKIKEFSMHEGNLANGFIGITEQTLEEEKKRLQEFLEAHQTTVEEMENLETVIMLREEHYSESLEKEYLLRIQNRREYYQEVERLTIEELDKQYKKEKEKRDKAQDDEWRTMYNARERELDDLEIHLEKGEITREKYEEAKTRLEKEYALLEVTIQDKYRSLDEQSEREHQEKIKKIKAQSYSSQIEEYWDFLSRLNEVDTTREIKNSWGIPNIKKIKERNREVLDAFTKLAGDIENEKRRLQQSLDANEISFDDFQQATRQLDKLQSNIGAAIQNIEEQEKMLLEDFIAAINYWIQQVGQTMNTILSSLSEMQSNQYDKMIEQQEKYIDEYEKLLDKQKEMTEKYASEVESIEDELSTARGDRRQQLIDQLNAEMAAQRASLAQEKKIEKEKEKAEEKKKKLEHDQAVAKKRMQLAQAAINAAMAVSMAAVNSWPVPAIPMMALAAAAGAAQIAAIQSQNIPSYGSGGVIQGKSHREGGVKVLGGQAEVEGGEYITNKVTTAKNVDLLDYINSKKKRINLEDLIDFYGGNSTVRKNIQTVRTKFAEGGVVPQLRNDISISDRLITAFEDYTNRPTVVSVVDIIDRTKTVNDVKVMAGLDI